MLLKRIRVLDFGRYIAGPVCASLLADLGADVIRIDRIGGSEDRYLMPVSETGDGALFLHANRNKRGMTLDPLKPAGQKILAGLVSTADVVVVNLPDAALSRLGLDYDSLKVIRPDIILTSISAFGSHGPYSDRTGFDIIGQAMSGMMHLTGQPGHPTKSFTPYVDFTTAMSAAFATLAAIMHRQETGEGQLVGANLLRSGVYLSQIFNLEQYTTGINREATGNRGQLGGPADLCHTRDGALVIHVLGASLFKRWTKLVAREDLLDDPRFQTDADRALHGEILSEITCKWAAQYTTEEAIYLMEQARVPGSPVYRPGEIIDDPHVKESGMISFHNYPGIDDPIPMAEPPFELSAIETRIRHRPPLNGENTQGILEELGYSKSEINELRQQRVI